MKRVNFIEFGCQGYSRNVTDQENEGSDSARVEEAEGRKHRSHLCNDPHTPSNDCSLCLCPAHPSKTRSNKHLSRQVFCLQVATAGIEHRELHTTQHSHYQELFFLQSLKCKDLLSLLERQLENQGSFGLLIFFKGSMLK